MHGCHERCNNTTLLFASTLFSVSFSFAAEQPWGLQHVCMPLSASALKWTLAPARLSSNNSANALSILSCLHAGRSSAEIPAILQKVVEAHGCSLVEGVLSHQLKRFIIDGNKCVLNKSTPETRVEDVTFEENEVYGIDIVVSTGEGKSRLTDERETTVSPALVPLSDVLLLPNAYHNADSASVALGNFCISIPHHSHLQYLLTCT